MSAARRVVPIEHWKDPRQRLGVRGEQAALVYLSARGWTIEAHRFRFERHDIDLVARRGTLVAFVEVKTRRTMAFGSGLEAVGWRKRRIVGKVAAVWRLRHGRPADSYRFDVIGIWELAGGGYEVEHIEDAWRLE